jgi:hypothetical protein
MIWRRLLVRSDSTLADLHYTLQIAFGWSDAHLNRFHLHGKDYGVAHLGGLSFDDNPEKVPLADFGFRQREWFLYEYDFFDHWQHEVRIEQILALDPKSFYPVCLGGKRAGPPEDCGGPRVYLERRLAVPCEVWDPLSQIVEAGDLEAIREQIVRLDPLRAWLALDRFDRRRVNQRLREYSQGEREWLFAEEIG